MKTHNFRDSLAASHAAEDLPCWEFIYRQAFPTMVGMYNHRHDGEHQRAGIDRSIILENSKQITIDEKARYARFDDILLEYVSNDQTGSPGWVEKHLLCDYVAYAVIPLGKAYLLPVIQLQSAWARNKKKWMELAERREMGFSKPPGAVNNGYRTLNIGVPIKTLFAAIGSALRVEFDPNLAETPET